MVVLHYSDTISVFPGSPGVFSTFSAVPTLLVSGAAKNGNEYRPYCDHPPRREISRGVPWAFLNHNKTYQ